VALLAAWNAEREGILSAIKEAGKKGRAVISLRDSLTQLEYQKPESPRVPRLILGDETPENLAYILTKNWPSAGVVLSEAGVVFGAQGMSKDSVMRNLALLNVLWDGGSFSIGRRTSESFTIKDARLTIALQIQEATLRAFFERSGGLAEVPASWRASCLPGRNPRKVTDPLPSRRKAGRNWKPFIARL